MSNIEKIKLPFGWFSAKSIKMPALVDSFGDESASDNFCSFINTDRQMDGS